MNKVVAEILEKEYPVVCSLQDYLCQVVINDDNEWIQTFHNKCPGILQSTLIASPIDINRCSKVKASPASTGNISDVIERVIRYTFSKTTNRKAANILTFGYTQSILSGVGNNDIINKYPNPYIKYLQKSAEWQALFENLGDLVIFHLLTQVCIFVVLDNDNALQLAGPPLPLKQHNTLAPFSRLRDLTTSNSQQSSSQLPKLNSVHFNRRAILYAKPYIAPQSRKRWFVWAPSLTLCKYPNDPKKFAATVIYPAEFNYPFPHSVSINSDRTLRVPKRLRKIIPLVKRLQKNLHNKINLYRLVNKYCPAKPIESTSSIQNLQSGYFEVVALVKAFILNLVPPAMWGSAHNRQQFCKRIDQFVRMRRNESFSLHHLMQGIKISTATSGSHFSRTEFEMHSRLIAQFMYFLLDTCVMKLLQTVFYVTECANTRDRLAYFRHDIWTAITAPTLCQFKQSLGRKRSFSEFLEYSDTLRLAPAKLRFIPKDTKLRTIMNFDYRGSKHDGLVGANISRFGQINVKSINSSLTDLLKILTFECMKRNLLGAASKGQRDTLVRITQFRDKQLGHSNPSKKLYLVKIDADKAFDKINFETAVTLLNQVFQHDDYQIFKYWRIIQSGKRTNSNIKVSESIAKPADEFIIFTDLVCQALVHVSRSNLFIDSGNKSIFRSRESLMGQINNMLNNIMVKIGKNGYYSPINGIPQGLKTSSLVCNLVYADFERRFLSSIVKPTEDLMIRLMDDFLFVTPDKARAKQFVSVLYKGSPSHGLYVNKNKTLVNFALEIDGFPVKRLAPKSCLFPYCGFLVHTRTLDCIDDTRCESKIERMSSLTVRVDVHPGRHIIKKIEWYAKMILGQTIIQTTQIEHRFSLYKSLYNCFIKLFSRTMLFNKALERRRKLSASQLMNLLSNIIKIAYTRLRRVNLPSRVVYGSQIRWLACHAFRRELLPWQTNYGSVVEQLDKEIGSISRTSRQLTLAAAAAARTN